jgi:hypothetical protein
MEGHGDRDGPRDRNRARHRARGRPLEGHGGGPAGDPHRVDATRDSGRSRCTRSDDVSGGARSAAAARGTRRADAGGGTLYGLAENRSHDDRYRAAYASCMRSRGYAR